MIIVAGGAGKRMSLDIPKQFIEINGLPILMHTISRFYNVDTSFKIRVVIPETEFERWNQLCADKHFNIPVSLNPGGETRFHSVKNGLKGIEPDSIVGIHDGVRPFVDEEVIKRCYTLAEKFGAVIPAINVNESIRKLTASGSRHVERSKYKLIQTPQVFNGQWIVEAYTLNYSPEFTDDASVAEAAGYKVHLTDGNRENIKITDAFDIEIAHSLISLRE